MQGLRKILRAVAIVVSALVGVIVLYGSASPIEVIVGTSFILFSLGLIATWFWQPL